MSWRKCVGLYEIERQRNTKGVHNWIRGFHLLAFNRTEKAIPRCLLANSAPDGVTHDQTSLCTNGEVWQ